MMYVCMYVCIFLAGAHCSIFAARHQPQLCMKLFLLLGAIRLWNNPSKDPIFTYNWPF